MITAHPTILTFRQTEHHTFPLILVIGREPNTDRPIDNTVGRYDFRQAPRCAFWNTAYSIIGEVAGVTNIRDFKSGCDRREASPIIFADALPIGIQNHVVNKDIACKLVDNVQQHVANIFSHTSIISRVKLVLMSGLYDSTFGQAKEDISNQCKQLSIPCVDVPFMYATNTAKLRQALDEHDRALIHGLIGQFYDACPEPANV